MDFFLKLHYGYAEKAMVTSKESMLPDGTGYQNLFFLSA